MDDSGLRPSRCRTLGLASLSFLQKFLAVVPRKFSHGLEEIITRSALLANLMVLGNQISFLLVGPRFEVALKISTSLRFALAGLFIKIGSALLEGLCPLIKNANYSHTIDRGDEPIDEVLWEVSLSLRFEIEDILSDQTTVESLAFTPEDVANLTFSIKETKSDAVAGAGAGFRAFEILSAEMKCYAEALRELSFPLMNVWKDAKVFASSGIHPGILDVFAEYNMSTDGVRGTTNESFAGEFELDPRSAINIRIPASEPSFMPGQDLQKFFLDPQASQSGGSNNRKEEVVMNLSSRRDRWKIFRPPRKSSYRHQVISAEGPEIRVLRVHKGHWTDPIVCSIETTSLAQPIPYEGLSYYWGVDEPIHQITILEDEAILDRKIAIMYVRYNLHMALKSLRRLQEDIWLWIDAICINQADFLEKNNQVAAMPRIFNMASSVKIWLGPETDLTTTTTDSARTFDFIRSCVMSDTSIMTKVAEWNLVIRLMKNTWFTRRWAFQELAYARKASLHWGAVEVCWSEFAAAVEVLKATFFDIKAESKRTNQSFDFTFSEIKSLGASAAVELMSSLFRKSPDGTILTPQHTLESLVSRMVAFECSDPRDIIFSCLVLASDGDKIKSDYEKHVLDVFTEFVEMSISTNRDSTSLDIICRHWTRTPRPLPLDKLRGKTDMPLPSWMPTVGSSEASGRDVLQRSFVGNPGFALYAAAGKLPPRVRFKKSLPESPEKMFTSNKPEFCGTLQAEGFRIAKVGPISARIIEGILPSEFLYMQEASYNTEIDGEIDGFEEQLWRTIVADRTVDRKNVPTYYKQLLKNCLNPAETSGRKDLDTKKLSSVPYTSRSMVNFLETVQSTTWNRKIFATRSKIKGQRRLGLAPPRTREGDLVCILHGCSVPVILREHEYDDSDEEYYELVGECFVYGIMDGEALSFSKRRIMDFQIR